MVLLTSTAVSAIISSGVVCIFTFLLFLSGYVLQQQTVRSLQEALRQPPEPRVKPTLPPTFRTVATEELLGNTAIATALPPTDGDTVGILVDAVTDPILAAYQSGRKSSSTVGDSRGGQQVPMNVFEAQSALEYAAKAGLSDDKRTAVDSIYSPMASPPDEASTQLPYPDKLSTAYVLPLLHPSALCSALLFARHHTSHTNLPPSRRPQIILLYPSTWETQQAPSTSAALGLMLSAIDSEAQAYGQIIPHPVSVSSIWKSPDLLESQLLAELQPGHRWTHDRMLYLQQPGMAIDIAGLDAALISSSLKQSWSPLRASDLSSSKLSSRIKSTKHQPLAPPLMLISNTEGLIVPRSNLRDLTTTLETAHTNHHEDEMEIEAQAASKGASWLVFDEEGLGHRRREKEWYGGLLERFEREKRKVCPEGEILES